MTDKTRIRIAGTVTAVFLAGISAVGLATHAERPSAALAPAAVAHTAGGAVAQQSGDDLGSSPEGHDG